MKIEQVLGKFENKSFSKIYLLETEEEVFKDEFLKKLKEKVSTPEFNWNIYYAEDANSEELLQCILSLPFLAQLKVAVIKNASQLSSKIIVQLSKNIDKIPSTNCLVLLDSKFPASLRNLVSEEQTLSFGKTTQSKMREWALKYLKAHYKTIDSDALSLLLGNAGLNFSFLARELDKLILYVQNKNRIVIEDAKKIGTEAKTYDIFELIDNISKKNTQCSLNALRGLLLDGISPQQIIGMLRWQFSNLWKVKSLISKGINSYNALEQAKVPYFKRNEFLAHIKKFTWDDLRSYFNLLLDTDMRIKRGGEPILTMELLLIKITK